MKLIVAVTGTPGTGKSTFAKELEAKLDSCEVIEVNDLVNRHKLYSSIDEFGSKIVDIKRLDRILEREIKKADCSVILIVGHLVPELDIKPRIVIVLRENLKTLVKRLQKRGYAKGKIRENIVSEAVNYCGARSRKLCKNTYEVLGKADKRSAMLYISGISRGVKAIEPKRREIDELHELIGLIKNGNTYGL
jgi:broad-specificity NMP kinase